MRKALIRIGIYYAAIQLAMLYMFWWLPPKANIWQISLLPVLGILFCLIIYGILNYANQADKNQVTSLSFGFFLG